jgi:hypothetical protein
MEIQDRILEKKWEKQIVFLHQIGKKPDLFSRDSTWASQLVRVFMPLFLLCFSYTKLAFVSSLRKKEKMAKQQGMENKKQVGSSPSSSSSSFCADLFGSKESTQTSASTGTFASVFPQPPTVLPTGYTQKQSMSNMWSTKQGPADTITNKKKNSIFQESVEPCPLSSSLCYGGPEDMYIKSSTTQTSSSNPSFKNDAVDDDPNGNNLSSASRGNWWKGSLYY